MPHTSVTITVALSAIGVTHLDIIAHPDPVPLLQQTARSPLSLTTFEVAWPNFDLQRLLACDLYAAQAVCWMMAAVAVYSVSREENQ
jgi:hypothetical protein